MHVIYDVSHNIAKVNIITDYFRLVLTYLLYREIMNIDKQVERHMVDGKPKTLLVHRKGSTRAFPPHHPLIPVDYQFTGFYIITLLYLILVLLYLLCTCRSTSSDRRNDGNLFLRVDRHNSSMLTISCNDL
jgi:hypothetical protein